MRSADLLAGRGVVARDDFPDKVKDTVAKRAAFFCSSPKCMKLTIGPHSDPNKSLKTGHAAHICAASPGGPRYDPRQSPESRKAIANAIWLCRECGQIVDNDKAAYTPHQLRKWKKDHEAVVSEVRTDGYSRSLALLQSRKAEPMVAKRIVTLLEDRRALWENFDAEFPDRVRQSLDRLRERLGDLRSNLQPDNPLDQILLSLTRTIHNFFKRVEKTDLVRLRCDANNPEWSEFQDALAALRKSIGLQISNLARAYHLNYSDDLARIVPTTD